MQIQLSLTTEEFIFVAILALVLFLMWRNTPRPLLPASVVPDAPIEGSASVSSIEDTPR